MIYTNVVLDDCTSIIVLLTVENEEKSNNTKAKDSTENLLMKW
jgi:hypothetical protein